MTLISIKAERLASKDGATWMFVVELAMRKTLRP